MEPGIQEQIFKKGYMRSILQPEHVQAFNLSFSGPSGAIIREKDHIITIGYVDSSGQLHGLAFKLYASNLTPSGEKPLHLKAMDRGYYRDGQLDSFGEQHFQKGIKYIGEFSRGKFEGKGVLILTKDKKWVYGKFNSGKLVSSTRSNQQISSERDTYGWADELIHLHRGFKQHYINAQIELISETELHHALRKALIPEGSSRVDLSTIREESETEKLDQSYEAQYQKRLDKIQEQFQYGDSKIRIVLPDQSGLPQEQAQPGRRSGVISGSGKGSGREKCEFTEQDSRRSQLKQSDSKNSSREVRDSVRAGTISKLINEDPKYDLDTTPIEELRPEEEDVKPHEKLVQLDSDQPLRLYRQVEPTERKPQPPLLQPQPQTCQEPSAKHSYQPQKTGYDPAKLSYTQILQRSQRQKKMSPAHRSRLVDLKIDREVHIPTGYDQERDIVAEAIRRRFRFSPTRLEDSVSPLRKFENSDSRQKHISVINKRKFNYLQQADIAQTSNKKYPVGRTASPAKVGATATSYYSSPVSEWSDPALQASPPSYESSQLRKKEPEPSMRRSRDPTFLRNNYINKI